MRTPGGDYLYYLKMNVVLDGHRPQTSTKFHVIPKNRTYLVQIDRGYPVRGAAKDSNAVEIDWDNYKKIDYRKALTQIIGRIRPILKAAGYRRTSRSTFNCVKEAGLIHVIDFQTYGDQFTINVAVYLREWKRRAGSAVNEKDVRASDCPMKSQWRIGEAFPRRYDRWWLFEAPDRAVEEISWCLTERLLPRLEKKYGSRKPLRQTKPTKSRVGRWSI